LVTKSREIQCGNIELLHHSLPSFANRQPQLPPIFAQNNARPFHAHKLKRLAAQMALDGHNSLPDSLFVVRLKENHCGAHPLVLAVIVHGSTGCTAARRPPLGLISPKTIIAAF
jgi:hypothetical protein